MVQRVTTTRTEVGIETKFLFVIYTSLKIYEDSMIQTQPNYLFFGQFRPPWQILI